MAYGVVAVQIAVPFAEFVVGEMAEREIVDFLEPVEILLLAGYPVSVQGGDKRFVVDPPELNNVFDLLGRSDVSIGEED